MAWRGIGPAGLPMPCCIGACCRRQTCSQLTWVQRQVWGFVQQSAQGPQHQRAIVMKWSGWHASKRWCAGAVRCVACARMDGGLGRAVRFRGPWAHADLGIGQGLRQPCCGGLGNGVMSLHGLEQGQPPCRADVPGPSQPVPHGVQPNHRHRHDSGRFQPRMKGLFGAGSAPKPGLPPPLMPHLPSHAVLRQAGQQLGFVGEPDGIAAWAWGRAHGGANRAPEPGGQHIGRAVRVQGRPGSPDAAQQHDGVAGQPQPGGRLLVQPACHLLLRVGGVQTLPVQPQPLDTRGLVHRQSPMLSRWVRRPSAAPCTSSNCPTCSPTLPAISHSTVRVALLLG